MKRIEFGTIKLQQFYDEEKDNEQTRVLVVVGLRKIVMNM